MRVAVFDETRVALERHHATRFARKLRERKHKQETAQSSVSHDDVCHSSRHLHCGNGKSRCVRIRVDRRRKDSPKKKGGEQATCCLSCVCLAYVTFKLASVEDDSRKLPEWWKLIEVTSPSWAG